MNPVLAVDRLDVTFKGETGRVSVLSQVSLALQQGEIFGLVGESGCGKTTLALSIMGLLPPTATLDGAIRFAETELLTCTETQLRQLRGNRMSMVFQDPLTALDPSFSVGYQITETIRAHRPMSRGQARIEAVELLRSVGIPDAQRRYDDPPHRFSGGMRQRVTIAIALANKPQLLLADEPTTALDVTIQAQVLSLIDERRREQNLTVVLITHDLGVVAQLCDRIGVMYAGQLVEVGYTRAVFADPAHPYTKALIQALPSANLGRGELAVIPGEIPNLEDPPPGCRFAPRCPLVRDACSARPASEPISADHTVACWAVETTPQDSPVATKEVAR